MGCLCIEENNPTNKNRIKEERKELRPNNIHIGNIIINDKIQSKIMGGQTNPITNGIKENNNAFTQSNEKKNYKNEIDNPYYNQPENQYPNIDDIEKSYEEYQEYQEEPLYEEIFFDGNSDCYDMILNFESFEQLKKQGWTANFSLEGWKKYQTSINSENIIIGVVGIKNRGKSYLLKRIMKNDNYKQNEGFLVTTYGISCGFPILEENNKYQAFVTLDTAGRDNPLLQNAFYQENDIRSIIKDQKVCEILLSDFIIKESNVLIAVVEQLSFAEQDMLTTLINRLKLKEVNNNIDKRKLIVIHNLMNINKVGDIKKFVKETLLKSMTFNLEPHKVEDYENNKYDLTVYDQLIENNKNSKLDIVHIVIGNNNVEEIQRKFNEPAFKYIRDYITISKLRKFDILKSFQEFMMENYKKFISSDLFKDNPLVITKSKKVKVYTDIKKAKEKIVDKIIKAIKLKDNKKIKEFSFKNFFFDSSGIYYSMEPLYSSQMIKEENFNYLEITFEMHGILKNIKYDVNYDDNNNKILIEIRGKTEQFELDIFKGEAKFEKKVGNLKYSDFDFQVIVDKYKTIGDGKYELEIEKKEPKQSFDKDTGICCFKFPLKLYLV